MAIFGASTSPTLIFTLTAINTAKLRFMSTGAVELEDRRNLWFTGNSVGFPVLSLPYKPTPNSSVDFLFSLPEVVRILQQQNKGQYPRYAWANDALGKRYSKRAQHQHFENLMRDAEAFSR